jgi:two-component system, cell cycle sensor histidine kinase and response regulator CckA
MQDQDKTKDNLIGKLSGLLSPYCGREQEEFGNVIDVKQIQVLMDDFYKLTNIGIAIIDLKGNILVATGWQDICTKFHRVHPDTLRNCIESDLHLTENVNEGEYLVYKCKNNMWDMVTPIVMGGRPVGNLFLGQFLFEDEIPDLAVFKAQAAQYGFDQDEYLAALQMVPRWSRDKVHTIMTFYSKFASMIGQLSYSNLKLANALIETNIAEAARRESEERNRSLIEHLPQRIFVKDRNSVYLSCNRNYASDLGLRPEQIIGKDDFAFHSPELARAYRADDQICMSTGMTKDFEETYQLAGQDRWAHTVKVPYRDRQGQVIGVLGIYEDITDRKQAETALRDSENHFRSLAETIPDALVVYDDLGRVTFINKAFEELYGWSVEELVGKPITNFVPPSAEAITKQSWERTLRGEKAVFETQRWTKEGKVLDLQISTAILRNIDGKHTASIVIHHDITARKRAQEKLHNSERTVKTILATSPVGIGLILDRKLKWVNDACLKMFGFENQEEIVGQSTRIFYPSQEEYERVGHDLYTNLQRGHIAETVSRFIRKDGSLFDVRIRIRHVDPSSSENLMIFVSTDITDQISAAKEKEALKTQLFQSQKMEALGTLVGGIAHDFNNMLQIVIGYSQILLEGKQKAEQGYSELQTIIETCQGGADLVKKLLALGQQGQATPVPLDLNHQISQLTTLISRTLPQIVQFDLDLANGPTTILSDSAQIDQLVMSLAINASEAMPNGGALKISTSIVSLDDDYCKSNLEAKPGAYVMLSVRDNGCGMDKETLTRIFDPFFSTKERGSTRGTGLGLSVVRGIVRQQGGHVTCESEPGKGTEFKVYFPSIEEPLMPAKMVEPQVQSGKPETILVVEDNIPVAELERRGLELAGYTVTVATTGREALEIYQTRKGEISLVILDLLMPEMSGRDCLMELLKIDPSVKVLIASGYSPSDELHREISPHVKGFVHKPFGMAQLLSAVESVLRDKG